jgi:SulP family sulfate permease
MDIPVRRDDKLALIQDQIPSLPPVVVLRVRNMTAIDATGLHALEELADNCRRQAGH